MSSIWVHVYFDPQYRNHIDDSNRWWIIPSYVMSLLFDMGYVCCRWQYLGIVIHMKAKIKIVGFPIRPLLNPANCDAEQHADCQWINILAEFTFVVNFLWISSALALHSQQQKRVKFNNISLTLLMTVTSMALKQNYMIPMMGKSIH